MPNSSGMEKCNNNSVQLNKEKDGEFLYLSLQAFVCLNEYEKAMEDLEKVWRASRSTSLPPSLPPLRGPVVRKPINLTQD